MRVRVIGGGLAGCEAVSSSLRGFDVELYEMRPGEADARAPRRAPRAARLFQQFPCIGTRGSARTPEAGAPVPRSFLQAAGGASAGASLTVNREEFSANVEAMIQKAPAFTCTAKKSRASPESSPHDRRSGSARKRRPR